MLCTLLTSILFLSSLIRVFFLLFVRLVLRALITATSLHFSKNWSWFFRVNCSKGICCQISFSGGTDLNSTVWSLLCLAQFITLLTSTPLVFIHYCPSSFSFSAMTIFSLANLIRCDNWPKLVIFFIWGSLPLRALLSVSIRASSRFIFLSWF